MAAKQLVQTTIGRSETTGILSLVASFTAILPLLLLCGQSAVQAADWPHYRGLARNGISAETLPIWPRSGPNRIWSANVGEGYSSVAVVGNKVLTLGNSNGRDTVYCLNAQTGKPVWTYSYPCPRGDDSYGGPRATPTVDNGKVYIMSRFGGVACLNAETGKLIWGRDVARETGAQPPQWAFAGSPLVEGNLVIFSIGATGTALDKSSGKIVWKSVGMAGYASPTILNEGGRRLALVFSGSELSAVDPATGRRIWQYPWETQYGVNASDPQFAGTDIFISSAYDRGCALIRTAGGRPSKVWQNRGMRNKFNPTVQYNGVLYGNDEGKLSCLDLKTGNERWSGTNLGFGGSVIAADGKLICLTDRGELVLIAATAERYNELTRAQVLNGSCWTHPVLANGRIYCRSHEGDIVCLDVKK
jgi:outer membrane protein assembly factor BamB